MPLSPFSKVASYAENSGLLGGVTVLARTATVTVRIMQATIKNTVDTCFILINYFLFFNLLFVI
jgi:hypothetical protein